MSIKLHAMMGVSTLAAIAAFGGVAQAQINGGGSSLVAPYHRQVADCYGVDRPLYARGTPPTPINTSAPYTPYIQPFAGCPTALSTSNTVEYISTGSGTGIAAVYSHDPLRYGDVDPAAGTQNYPSVQYGLSETALSNADVTTYNSGGVIQGVTLTASPSGANQYPIPEPLYGKLVQFPVAVAPVALAYDPVYKKVADASGAVTSYRFAVNAAFARANGGLRLSQATYCKILNGQITDWNDAAITADNGGVSLKDPADPASFSVPIELVGRSDSSGTTQVTTRHLAAACGSLAGNAFTAAAGTSTLPPALIGNAVGGAPISGKFTVASGTNGSAAYLGFTATPAASSSLTQGRLGYLGADYTLPNSANNSLPYALFTADLQNGAGAYRAPTAANATTAFGANRPPETATGASGDYDPTVTAWGVRSNPADWTRVGNLANPTPAQAYPIVATVNWIGYTCYAAGNVDVVRTASAGGPVGYLNYWFDDAIVDTSSPNILANAGLAGLPPAWQAAIKNTFLTPTTTGANPTAPLNLGIATAGTGLTGTSGVTNSTCSSKVGA
ncbi:substrate-binding domain-containing protein [Caulobacter endophyticus]|uniref:substrate-binding domain-containing protein n=1 Tax=Caulobacter endophyticus TaxID=2172652 RepID=UPI0024102E7A|nr:substrate-binding domain-containing protein [Caulobacter endophyticus]MDG2527250.1 substrate-binding domain-containing protein [Caulobacter endophyticus]